MDWEQRLNETPRNWNLRFQYAFVLEQEGKLEYCKAQRWILTNKKCPGPPCVQEASPSEVTWFVEGCGARWAFPYFVNENEVDENWRLPVDIFEKLKGFITDRRDRGFHNRWAKSWNSRQEAELALAEALSFDVRKRKYRSIEDEWTPSLKLD